MEFTDDFLSEWNRLVRLYRTEGRTAIDARMARHRGVRKAVEQRIAASSRPDGPPVKWPKGLGAAALKREVAARRMLARLGAERHVYPLQRPVLTPEDVKLQSFLKRDAPVDPPLSAGFNALDKFVETWHECVELERDKGLEAVKKLCELREQEIVRSMSGIAGRQQEALHGLSPQDVGDLSVPGWCKVAVEMEDAIANVDESLGFPIRVMRRFLALALRKPTRRYPPDWNYLVAISPFPEEWAAQADEETKTDPQTEDENNRVAAIKRMEPKRLEKLIEKQKRDAEIAAAFESARSSGMTYETAKGHVAEKFSVSDSTVERAWRANRQHADGKTSTP